MKTSLAPAFVSIASLVLLAGLASAQDVAKPMPVPAPGAPAAQTPPPGTAVPKIEALSQIDLGTISDDKEVEGTITFKNVGSAPLEILGVRGSCGCTVPSLDKLEKRVFDPGQGGSFAVKYNPHNRRGPQQTIVYVKTNDPMVPEAQVHLKTVVKPLVSVEPQGLNLGQIQRGAGATGTVTITSLVPGLTITQATANNPQIQATVLETKPTTVEGEAGTQTTLKITVPPGMTVGPMGEYVTIRTSDQARTLGVSVNAEVVGNFVVSPTQLSLPGLAPNSPVNTQIRIASREEDKPFKIVGVSDSKAAGDASFRFEVVPDPNAKEGTAYFVKMAGIAPNGALRGEVVIETDNAEERTIPVRYFGFARAATPQQPQQQQQRDPWAEKPSLLIPR